MSNLFYNMIKTNSSAFKIVETDHIFITGVSESIFLVIKISKAYRQNIIFIKLPTS